LNAFMDRYADRKLPEPLIKDFTRMILEGLVSIHGHGYVHCDLKPDNLLVFPSSSRQDSSYEIKISDFGNSLEVGEVPLFWETDFPWVGTPIYMPPESVRDGVANKSLDLWSLGCLVREMYTGVIPWEGIELDDIATLLICGEAPWIPECLPSDAKAFIQTCFSSDPEDRGSAYELLFHPFLPRPEVQEEEKKTVDKTRSSFLLKLLKLRIRGRSLKRKKPTKDALAVSDKKPLKLRFFPTKAQQFKRTLNKVLRLKAIPMKKSSDFNLVSVH
ncbi:mitogen-activated protein kinase kinase kinase 20-like, partial [Raphanus sativus]|uniref:Mitogen-activated protein kinase kinase kinase 20-like n=1 Tax=Raphanus sativus TaxID=3726 RepID=A0A9W3CBK5_RAPSA